MSMSHVIRFLCRSVFVWTTEPRVPSFLCALLLGACAAASDADDQASALSSAPATQPSATATGSGSAAPSSSGVNPRPEDEALVNDEVKGPSGGFLPSERVDLLFVIDNSSSMADKQAIFKATIPDLIDQMVNPPCEDSDTGDFYPYSDAEGCGGRGLRIFSPVNDIHIAMLSSSLGPLGTEGNDVPLGCADVPQENDRAWLLGRVRPELTAESYQNWGFLAWDPEGRAEPPGDSDLTTLIGKFERQVDTIGELGCGFEAPLEAAYRFLSEPDPYLSLERTHCPNQTDGDPLCFAPSGLDTDLLAQREQFLRPDSVVVVIFLTDENDCSLKANGQGYLGLSNRQLRGATSACNADPNDACCLPCGLPMPAGCDDDPETNGCADDTRVDDAEARPLRCFDQQRRFGVSFLRSTDVYVGGYVNELVADRAGQPQRNALFTEHRGRDEIFVVGIIGVPWQDTSDPAQETATKFDLIESTEVAWERFLPTNGMPATDPWNIEAMTPRAGAHPITGEQLAGPGSWNSINGHDRALAPGDGMDDDLQFSCIFELPEPRDCLNAEEVSCDCITDVDAKGNVQNFYEQNPLCYDQRTGSYGQTQYYAKAFPAPRMLEVLRGVSCPPGSAGCTEQSVLASICPRQLSDDTRQDYGYRPVIRALLLNLRVPDAH